MEILLHRAPERLRAFRSELIGGDLSATRAVFVILRQNAGTFRARGNERVGKIGMFKFANAGVLEKAGDNLYKNTSNLGAEKAEDAKVRQGFLESSNVKPVLEITRMVEVSRAYEQTTRMMDAEADLSRRAVDRLGRIQ